MTRRWAAFAIVLTSWAVSTAPRIASAVNVHARRLGQGSNASFDVAGVWQTVTTDIRYPFNVTKCGPAHRVTDPEPGTPWTFWLAQSDTTVTGTVQQSGPDNWCASEPVPVEDGRIEGDRLSLRLETPSGSTVEFLGVIQADGGSIAFTKSAAAPDAGAPWPNNLGPFDLTNPTWRHFVIERVTTPASNGCPDGTPASEPAEMPRCEVADLQAPPFAVGTSQWAATDGVEFSPWTFDLTIGANGILTGHVAQTAVDRGTRAGPVAPGPFAIASGQADARRLSFTVQSPDGARVATFSGVRRGRDAIEFRRFVTVVNKTLSGAIPADLFGLEPAVAFTAHLVSSDAAAGAVPASPVSSDDTVALESIDGRFAAVPPASQAAVTRPALALIRYRVEPTYQGRLFVLILDAAGEPLRHFEVVATPGSHVAMWDLHPTGTLPATATDDNATDQTLRTAEARAMIVADTIRLAAAAPSEVSGAQLLAALSRLLAGPDASEPAPVVSRLVPPGNDSIALARLEGGAFAILATRSLVITVAGDK